MAIICSDNFNGPDGGFSGRTLNNALGGSASKTWTIAQNPWTIVSNVAWATNYGAMALVDASTVNKLRARIRTAETNNRSALVANGDNQGNGPGVIAYLSTENNAIVMRQMNSGDFFGPDRNSTAISVSNNTEYYMELERASSTYTARLYSSDGVTLIGAVSYDFGGDAASFTGNYWGITSYSGDNIAALSAVFYSAEAEDPPTVEITDFHADGPDLVIEYDHTSTGTGQEITATLEVDGLPYTPNPTSSVLSGELRVVNPGPGEYELTELFIEDSNGDDSDGPWPTPVEIIGLGEMEIEGEVDVTLGSISITATATVQGGINGEVNETLGNLTVTSEAVINTQITGTLSKTLKNATLNSKGYVGEVPPPPTTGYTIGGPYLTLNISLTVT